MTNEYNVYNNLDEMLNCNLLDGMKSLAAAKISNKTSHNVTDEFDEFESLLNNNVEKSPKKRTTNNKSTDAKEVLDKKKKKETKSKRSSSRERSFSPPLELLANLNSVKTDIPVSARTRRSLGKTKNATETNNANQSNGIIATEVPTSSKRGGRGGRGGNRGKGRGRGKGKKANTSIDELIIADESSNNSCDNSFGDVTVQEHPISSADIMERFLGRGRQTRNCAARNRRNYVAEIAAYCPTVDTIDLISSPFPQVQGCITLDSDGEVEEPITIGKDKIGKDKKENILDISLEDDNPEISVKITWKGKPEAFKLRKYQKFSTIFKLLAEREGTVSDNIVLNLKDHIITPDDTPESIGYKIFHFINGRVLAGIADSPLGPAVASKKQRNPNQISIKVQSDKWKRPLQIDMLKSDKFRILYIKCSEELNVDIEQIKLSFDGEHLEINDTPADLDFEGGEAVDLRLKN